MWGWFLLDRFSFGLGGEWFVVFVFIYLMGLDKGFCCLVFLDGFCGFCSLRWDLDFVF